MYSRLPGLARFGLLATGFLVRNISALPSIGVWALEAFVVDFGLLALRRYGDTSNRPLRSTGGDFSIAGVFVRDGPESVSSCRAEPDLCR